MAQTVTDSGQPRMTDSTTAGAYKARPTPSPRWIRKTMLARVRVLESKRFSRYS